MIFCFVAILKVGLNRYLTNELSNYFKGHSCFLCGFALTGSLFESQLVFLRYMKKNKDTGELSHHSKFYCINCCLNRGPRGNRLTKTQVREFIKYSNEVLCNAL